MEVKNYSVRLHGIEILEKSYNAIAPPADGQDFHFDYAIKSGIDPDRNLLIVVIEISVRLMDDPNVLSKLSTGTAFELPNINEELTKLENGQYAIPPALDLMVKSIALSTARGVLFSELRGTPLHRAFLPLIQLQLTEPIPLKEEPSS